MELDFKVGNNDKYKVEVIWNILFYIKILKMSHLTKLYYFISSKSYLKEKNMWKSIFVMQYF